MQFRLLIQEAKPEPTLHRLWWHCILFPKRYAWRGRTLLGGGTPWTLEKLWINLRIGPNNSPNKNDFPVRIWPNLSSLPLRFPSQNSVVSDYGTSRKHSRRSNSFKYSLGFPQHPLSPLCFKLKCTCIETLVFKCLAVRICNVKCSMWTSLQQTNLQSFLCNIVSYKIHSTGFKILLNSICISYTFARVYS